MCSKGLSHPTIRKPFCQQLPPNPHLASLAISSPSRHLLCPNHRNPTLPHDLLHTSCPSWLPPVFPIIHSPNNIPLPSTALDSPEITPSSPYPFPFCRLSSHPPHVPCSLPCRPASMLAPRPAPNGWRRCCRSTPRG